MSNQGLSIFDHEPDNSGDEPTQVIPRDAAEQGSGTQKTAQKVAEKPAEKPAAVQAPPRPQQTPDAAHPAAPRQQPRPVRRRPPRPRRQPSSPRCRPCGVVATTPPRSTSTCAP